MSNKRFRVAFSFAGEKRRFVAKIAAILAKQFGNDSILYDKYHEAEFARPDLGVTLPELYHDESDLVVVVVCPNYSEKEWAGLEWMAIHDLIKNRKTEMVMLCRFEQAKLKGVFSTAGWIELDEKSPEETADLILQRLEIIEGKPEESNNSHSGVHAVGDTAISKGVALTFLGDGFHFEEPSIIWKLPRGFVWLTDIVKQKAASWATVADYYSYDGNWIHATHYHESYLWGQVPNGIERQCSKLQIPKGDWYLARSPIYCMMEIREDSATILEDGKLEGRLTLDPRIATLHSPGPIRAPEIPDFYRGLAASGELRDLALNATELSKTENNDLTVDRIWDRLEESAKELRREARLQIYQLLPNSHPASKNLAEVIEAFEGDRASIRKWLREFSSTVSEAASYVEKLQEADD